MVGWNVQILLDCYTNSNGSKNAMSRTWVQEKKLKNGPKENGKKEVQTFLSVAVEGYTKALIKHVVKSIYCEEK